MRKPIDAVTRGMRTPRERVWIAVRKLRTNFTRLAVGEACDPPVTQFVVDKYVGELMAAGFIARVAKGKVVEGRGSVKESDLLDLVKDQHDAPPVTTGGRISTKGVGRTAMWRVMRMLTRGFDYREVARLASVDDFLVMNSTAQRYVNALARAGYFTVLKPATNTVPARYKLALNTGPIAPVLTEARGVFDRNTGSFQLAETAQEVCDGIGE